VDHFPRPGLTEFAPPADNAAQYIRRIKDQEEDMGRLDGQVAIVTGAAQGIGAAYARGIAAEGASVVVNDISDPAALVSEITDAGGKALGIVADVTDQKAVDAMVRQTVEAFGKLDILVNNAALFGDLKMSKFDDIPEGEWDAVLRVNVRGVWQMSKAAVAEMRKRKYGKIVNIASGTVFKGTPMMLHYVSSKGAIVAMSRAMAREVGDDNICVNTIAPGLTESEAVANAEQWTDERLDQNAASRSIKRREAPEDLVGTVIFLASHESDFITGQVLVVDGGAVAH
jgi:NAD(P)-dependent dehydrogenase (short-subunit alcohol dehydrogenase family)